ncbi:MAG: hypothetical protein NC416_17195 [Eubacterium sp.]|nr:hypothetical protein [Eubacterium sp.]
MMGRKKNSRGDILIDLTSLLDVVFIFLLIVLCTQQNMKQNLDARENQIDERESRLQAAEDQQELYQQKLDMVDQMQKYAVTVAIQSSYDAMDIKKRYIRVLIGSNEEPDIFDLIGEETEEPMALFKEKLKACIEEDLERPVVFAFNEDEEKILRRDKIAIDDTLDALKHQYENVYISNGRLEN